MFVNFFQLTKTYQAYQAYQGGWCGVSSPVSLRTSCLCPSRLFCVSVLRLKKIGIWKIMTSRGTISAILFSSLGVQEWTFVIYAPVKVKITNYFSVSDFAMVFKTPIKPKVTFDQDGSVIALW